ncbi:hypothetical protein L2E82_33145 [Cichorium intybus]|uniref:Uncharacterized protein n=1 Tax=Cichorium intybus TaxID=13427 RepID=A0ACB9BJC7_CICIN|nr:hypothetical protein L2E82_33145 [Cichorium intybus]
MGYHTKKILKGRVCGCSRKELYRRSEVSREALCDAEVKEKLLGSEDGKSLLEVNIEKGLRFAGSKHVIVEDVDDEKSGEDIVEKTKPKVGFEEEGDVIGDGVVEGSGEKMVDADNSEKIADDNLGGNSSDLEELCIQVWSIEMDEIVKEKQLQEVDDDLKWVLKFKPGKLVDRVLDCPEFVAGIVSLALYGSFG